MLIRTSLLLGLVFQLSLACTETLTLEIDLAKTLKNWRQTVENGEILVSKKSFKEGDSVLLKPHDQDGANFHLIRKIKQSIPASAWVHSKVWFTTDGNPSDPEMFIQGLSNDKVIFTAWAGPTGKIQDGWRENFIHQSVNQPIDTLYIGVRHDNIRQVSQIYIVDLYVTTEYAPPLPANTTLADYVNHFLKGNYILDSLHCLNAGGTRVISSSKILSPLSSTISRPSGLRK